MASASVVLNSAYMHLPDAVRIMEEDVCLRVTRLVNGVRPERVAITHLRNTEGNVCDWCGEAWEHMHIQGDT